MNIGIVANITTMKNALVDTIMNMNITKMKNVVVDIIMNMNITMMKIALVDIIMNMSITMQMKFSKQLELKVQKHMILNYWRRFYIN